MSKTNYALLALLAISIVGNIVQSQRYEKLLAQREYVYDGAVDHLRATLKRELTALDEAEPQ